MAIRVRKNGLFICAALCIKKDGDVYKDDREHYIASVIRKTISTNNKGLHKHKGGVWKPVRKTNIFKN